MRKINKTPETILSSIYVQWVGEFEVNATPHSKSYTYYVDVAMNLYKCQLGVCAYTERKICPNELYLQENWQVGRHILSEDVEYNSKDHEGELDHFNPSGKDLKYWDWNNLFMIDSKVNALKSNLPVVEYLKPDLEDYSPEIYFDYDEKTNRFRPNTDIEDKKLIAEIQYMIDKILHLNHGMLRNDRSDFINIIRDKKKRGEEYKIDRFFTAVKLTLGLEPQ